MKWSMVLALMLAACTPVPAVGRLHGFGGDRALVLADSASVEAQDTCVGDACAHRGLRGEQQATPPEFEPTHEWKEILPNQPVPPGLYIRINLETGRKEAKLLD